MIALNRATLLRLLKPVLTILAAALAALVLWHLYTYYTYAPQTRDGKIRADVVPLAADVSGRVEEVHVRDNQVVRKGELLFTIDSRSDERRVGTELVRTCRSRGAPFH